MEASVVKLAREIRMAISNGVTEEYTAQQIREAITPLVDALVEARENVTPWAVGKIDAALTKVNEGAK